jgi:hypothetical protein
VRVDGIRKSENLPAGTNRQNAGPSDAHGDPNPVLYEFTVPLEDPALRWMPWMDGAYVSWRPPQVGASQTLPPARGIWD